MTLLLRQRFILRTTVSYVMYLSPAAGVDQTLRRRGPTMVAARPATHR